MTDIQSFATRRHVAGRALSYAVPAGLILAAAVGGALLAPRMGGLTGSEAPLSPDEFARIEFLAQSGSTLDTALTRGCAASGCDGELVSTLVRVEAAAMTTEELEEAIRVQAISVREIDAGVAAAGSAAPSADLLSEAAARHALLDFYAALRDRRDRAGSPEAS